MYPFIRLIWQVGLAKRQSRLGFFEPHVSSHVCMPWDCDMFGEMNNGRILTWTDTGRFPLALRVGLLAAIIRRRWALTMAGATVRWQRRILPFRRYEMRTNCIGHDGRFFYLHHTIWRGGICHASVLYRSCARKGARRIPMEEMLEELGVGGTPAGLPGWAEAWRQAEDARVWPPQDGSIAATRAA